MQRRVAIKRLDLPRDRTRRDLHDPPGLAEARTAAMLNHPAIVTVYDFETDSDEAFLIMEYVDGASLESVARRRRRSRSTLDETAAVIAGRGSTRSSSRTTTACCTSTSSPPTCSSPETVASRSPTSAWPSSPRRRGTARASAGRSATCRSSSSRACASARPPTSGRSRALAYECLTGANPFDAETIAGRDRAARDARSAAGIRVRGRRCPAAVDDILFAATRPAPRRPLPDRRRLRRRAARRTSATRDAGRRLARRARRARTPTTRPSPRSPAGCSVGLWDRLQGRARRRSLLRAVAAVESAWLTWAGLAPTHLQPLPLLGATALIALAGALAPSLGTGLGLVAFAIGLFAQRLLGARRAVLGRRRSRGGGSWHGDSAGAAVLPLSAPVLGVAHVPLRHAAARRLLAARAARGRRRARRRRCCSCSRRRPRAQARAVRGGRPAAASSTPARGLLVAATCAPRSSNPATWVALARLAARGAADVAGLARRATRLSATDRSGPRRRGARRRERARATRGRAPTLGQRPTALDRHRVRSSRSAAHLYWSCWWRRLGAPVRAKKRTSFAARTQADE